MTLGWHLRLAARDRRVLAPDEATRRRVVRGILDCTSLVELLAFSIADTHLHAQIAACPRGDAMAAGKRHCLGRFLRARFEPIYLGAIEDQHHMVRTFSYVLRQHERHSLADHAWLECTSYLDWAGGRPRGARIAPTVERWLPRANSELQRVLGASSDGLVESTSAGWIVPAGLCATALPDLRGSDRERNQLRRVLMELLPSGGCWSMEAQATLLAISPRTHRRLRSTSADPVLHRAVEQLLAIAARVPALAEQFEREAGLIKARRRGNRAASSLT